MAFTFKDRAQSLAMEFDGRHPKMRLALVAHMVDAGYLPTEGHMGDYVNELDKLMEWIMSERLDFFSYVESLDPEEDKDQISDISMFDTVTEGDGLGGSYL